MTSAPEEVVRKLTCWQTVHGEWMDSDVPTWRLFQRGWEFYEKVEMDREIRAGWLADERWHRENKETKGER